jgi:hypothetical protein
VPAKIALTAFLLGIGSASPADVGLGALWHPPQLLPRPEHAPGGAEFARHTRDLPAAERQRAVLEELERGNLPDFLRAPVPVQLTGRKTSGETVHATIFVLPDYLAIGSNDDFIYAALGFGPATAVARRYRSILPTPKMVDAIYAQSLQRLTPTPLPPGPLMASMSYLEEHQRRIERQRQGLPRRGLVSGHKKDLVVTPRLLALPERVAIYGWHRALGQPIQPLSLVHGETYADYSHGIRLVSETVLVEGRPRSIYEALGDPAIAPALTYQGVFPEARRVMRIPGTPVARSSDGPLAER